MLIIGKDINTYIFIKSQWYCPVKFSWSHGCVDDILSTLTEKICMLPPHSIEVTTKIRLIQVISSCTSLQQLWRTSIV